MPSQVSGDEAVPIVVYTQTAGPFRLAALHWNVPVERHAPTMPLSQDWPLFGCPSSILPSQSLSLPSHSVSAVMLPIASFDTSGSVYVHLKPCAPMHAAVCALKHSPALRQRFAGGVSIASVVFGLQSLSMPSQTSAPEIVHGPYSQPSATWPLTLW